MMSLTHPIPADEEEQNQLLWKGFEKFFDRIYPWLFDLGLWIFGSLIAFNLLILASLFTVGPVDGAVTVATAALALALPVNVTGLFLLRLVRELKDVKVEDELAQAFLDVGFTGGGRVAAPPALEAMRRRRTKIVLSVSPGVLVLGVLLTMTGLVATLWHMARWIAAGFLVMALFSLLTVISVIAASQPRDSREDESHIAGELEPTGNETATRSH
jgi:hypothetical protein